MRAVARWFGCILSLSGGFTAVSVPAAETMPAGLYEVTTETGMPHLEENLRYAVTRENRCLTGEDLAAAFPILQSASLADCKLQPEGREGEVVSFLLTCSGGHGTTGAASWRVGEHLIVGKLSVKLGGKNMTFFQRVTAKPLGQCSSGTPLRNIGRPR
ncbi:MAG TPA: DUF3617 family protein [Steroidobacteraceae bacterium]|jgi:hypothetical protein